MEDIHPLIDNIQASVNRYRLQSLSHFSVHIDVQLDAEHQPEDYSITKGLKLKVVFQNHATCQTTYCRPLFRKDKLTDIIQVREKHTWIKLHKFLSIHFPADDSLVTEDTMRNWWDHNGKTFNWTGLPTELKLQILQFCVCVPHGLGDFKCRLLDFKRRYARRPGPYEIIDPLGDWGSLFRVSHQVRALVLYLVLVRNDRYPGGLAILSCSLGELKNAMYRLGNYLQLIQPNSVPFDSRSKALARQYLNFPKQYPHLSRYATMRHGIRKMCLRLDFMETLHFFKVSVGNLAEYRGRNFMTCDIFQKLPNLDGLHIILPRSWWKDRAIQMGPQLFHETAPCPRTLHRFIYERAAVELAPYRDVRIEGFMDQFEKERFWDCYKEAVLRWEFTIQDLDELYAECGGGVQLEDESAQQSVSSHESLKSSNRHEVFLIPESEDDTFPPECHCEVPCMETFFA
jgi:hypothetical protein